MMRRCLLSLLACLLASTALGQEWSLSIRENNLEDGTALTLMAEPGRLVVTRSAGDAPPTLIAVTDLSEDQNHALATAIAEAWEANLDQRALTSDLPQAVLTDLRLRFDGQARQMRVGDVGVPALIALTQTINEMVSVESRLIYPLMTGRSPSAGRPIVAGLELAYYTTEVRILNRQEGSLTPVLRKLRRDLGHGDDRRAAEAARIMDRVGIWHQQQLDATRSRLLDDRPGAYANATRMKALLRGDELGQPFSEIARELSRDGRELREIRAALALREALSLGEAVGLDGDLDAVNWSRFNQQKAARAILLLQAVGERWQRTAAADEAARRLKLWHRRVNVLNEMAPGWRYTHSFALIPIGTDQRVTIRTDDLGNVTTTIDEEIEYDPRQVYMSGSFRNTSSRAYRYTFVVAVSSSLGQGDLFDPEDKQNILGYEQIQTPVLEPGEVWNWETVLRVRSVYQIRKADIGQVSADQPQLAE
ncbi:MAG: hypothetical protein AAGH88_02435 [Planctomycetota bacterium]